MRFSMRNGSVLMVIMAVLGLLGAPVEVEGGPAAGAICSSGCAAVVVAGATFGTVTAGAGTPAIILGCNSAFGTCMSYCAVATAMPTP